MADDVQAGRVKAADLVEQSLAAIDKHKEYQAIIVTLADSARSRAKAIDEKVANGEKAGRLAGVPFIAKDNYLVFGAETTAASNILKGFTAPYQATVIERLEAEGAICVAKANLDAFAHGASTENSDFFTTSNARDKQKVAGGSSGGSAVAVALEMTPFALGTDTGGSTRQPASYNGCVGYKPTYGLMSRSGIVAMASSTDTVGTFARSVEDACLVIDVMAGKDELDGTTIDRNPTGYVLSPQALNLSSAKVGVIKEWMGEGLDDDVRTAIETAIRKLRDAGADVREVSVPSLPLALAVYYIICPAEVSSNLARHDGQRFGHFTGDARDLTDSYTRTRQMGFGRETKRRIMIGTYVLSSGYYDAYYKKAQTVRTKLINEFDAVLKDVDFLIGPVAPNTAFQIGDNVDDPLKMYLVDMMTVGPSMVGVPAISIPCAVGDGMPVGLQIIAAQKHDRELLEFAAAAEGVIQ
ncbi:Asp-tRNA(Asn)/Glu-tRNA(Gln) amidotransferase subunit GatA [Candidatus Saccharibacteria bacterium]|nr:MAG: Asp-tRNA(Asn)/Glu-tRNA(Gln) amidotransferase subunit GatA [Candidatus Saccharibacteria bacterium]